VPDFPARVQSHIPGGCPGVAAHLWSTGYSARAVCLIRSSTSAAGARERCRGGRNGGEGDAAGAGTLLGPEGTAAWTGSFLLCGLAGFAW
jgi:hypothetical protein